MKKSLTLLAGMAATPAFAASGPFFSLHNTNFVVLLAFLVFIGVLIYFKVPGMLGGALDKRSDKIQADLDEARSLMKARRIEKLLVVDRDGKLTGISNIEDQSSDRVGLRIVVEIKRAHEAGQPILVGTTSIEKSEDLSGLLKKAGIPHNVLNARQHEKEAQIVAEAGQHREERVHRRGRSNTDLQARHADRSDP